MKKLFITVFTILSLGLMLNLTGCAELDKAFKILDTLIIDEPVYTGEGDTNQ